MPEINFCFSGWINGADIDEVTVFTDGMPETKDISQESAAEVVAKLRSGEYALSLADSLGSGRSQEVEIFDYDHDTD